jgi:hypothetical protein
MKWFTKLDSTYNMLVLSNFRLSPNHLAGIAVLTSFQWVQHDKALQTNQLKKNDMKVQHRNAESWLVIFQLKKEPTMKHGVCSSLIVEHWGRSAPSMCVWPLHMISSLPGSLWHFFCAQPAFKLLYFRMEEDSTFTLYTVDQTIC